MIRVFHTIAFSVIVFALAAVILAAPDSSKPRIAFFPLGGDAPQELRDKVAFALRTKLDRTGSYEVIDGAKMAEIASESADPISSATSLDSIKTLNKLADAKLLVWGELASQPSGTTLHLQIVDLREANPKPKSITKVIKQATDLRFITEEVLQALPGVKTFEHPPEESVVNDPAADHLWKTGPNLVINGDFSQPGHWQAIYMAQKYAVKVSSQLPGVDQVNIYKTSGGAESGQVLAMNLSRTCAENNGMACLSDPIEIAPDTRYRISFRYKSDGPTLHVFVKGYTPGTDIQGKAAEREIYRRQVPPSGSTKGKWVTVVDDFNPQHVAFPVKYLRIDLYAYLSPGSVMFDDVVLKAVGQQTHKAHDDAIKPPVSRPASSQ